MLTIILYYLIICLIGIPVCVILYYYDLWKYGECIEMRNGSIVYSKSISRAMPAAQAIRSRSFAPNVTKGATLLSLSHKN